MTTYGVFSDANAGSPFAFLALFGPGNDVALSQLGSLFAPVPGQFVVLIPSQSMSMSALKKIAPPMLPGPPFKLQTWATVPLSSTKSPGSLEISLAAVQSLVRARSRASAGEPVMVPSPLIVPPKPASPQIREPTSADPGEPA